MHTFVPTHVRDLLIDHHRDAEHACYEQRKHSVSKIDDTKP